jgi:hypothetical protein
MRSRAGDTVDDPIILNPKEDSEAKPVDDSGSRVREGDASNFPILVDHFEENNTKPLDDEGRHDPRAAGEADSVAVEDGVGDKGTAAPRPSPSARPLDQVPLVREAKETSFQALSDQLQEIYDKFTLFPNFLSSSDSWYGDSYFQVQGWFIFNSRLPRSFRWQTP